MEVKFSIDEGDFVFSRCRDDDGYNYIMITAKKKLFVVHVCQGSSGFEIDEVEAGEEWTEGVGEEYMGAFPTKEEANQKIERYLESL